MKGRFKLGKLADCIVRNREIFGLYSCVQVSKKIEIADFLSRTGKVIGIREIYRWTS